MKTIMAILFVAMALIGGAYAGGDAGINDPTAYASGDAWATVDATPAFGTTYTVIDNYAYADYSGAFGSSYAGSNSNQNDGIDYNVADAGALADASANYYANTYASSNTFAGPGVSQSSEYGESFSDSFWVQSTADSYGSALAYGYNTYTDAWGYTNTYADAISGSSYSTGYAVAQAL